MAKTESIHLDKTDCSILLEALKAFYQASDGKVSYDLKYKVDRIEKIYSRVYQLYIKFYRGENRD